MRERHRPLSVMRLSDDVCDRPARDDRRDRASLPSDNRVHTLTLIPAAMIMLSWRHQRFYAIHNGCVSNPGRASDHRPGSSYRKIIAIANLYSY